MKESTRTKKCIVFGCRNRAHEGRFVGRLCAPCDKMLRTGIIGHGDTFIHTLDEKTKLRVRNALVNSLMIKLDELRL